MTMRVLLDEQLDHRLKPLFDRDFVAVTVHERGWGSMKDGALLRAAQAEFDALVTMDRGIPHQQKVQALSLGIVVVRAMSNRRADVAPLIPKVNDVLREIGPGEVVYVSA
jgi:predicted nuclease of predicted toxin-antitoxin system